VIDVKINTDAVIGIVVLAFAGLFIEGNIDFIGLPLAGVGLYYILKMLVKRRETPAPPK
jgi:hypothetical protein